MSFWTDKYVGIPYDLETTNCGWLVSTVLKEQFDTEIQVPSEADEHFIRRSIQVSDTLNKQFVKIPERDAQDGDIVLMKVRGRLSHVGIFVKIGTTRYVLHTTKGHHSILQSFKNLKMTTAMHIEGIYRIKDKYSDEAE